MNAKMAYRLMFVLHDLDMNHPEVLDALIESSEFTEAEYVDAYDALCADCNANEAPLAEYLRKARAAEKTGDRGQAAEHYKAARQADKDAGGRG